ncbi:cytochrome c biogenesis CcdA family protein [Desulfobacca acetoxidans]|uniref:Cytochrome c biogenesis protein transmembrane region n=1 Tax=Desulfobacca acetoxidans (strain ATCC 700848 / DSM 11109 / ASRB2) TaxID=880072 RepID=F2NHW0_DESAR|nr:cytochrome c biogenesis protein CcdA [Desulfobacca acetoxidans]AEB09445.1 cytochrome c biogenesis protein transmembrane region [Desulfobacca acetoxidans DSM 11109]HAY23065.1 cytochrome C biogenesis protein CcdA [Desulfobacterales bacterium]
MDLSGYLTQVMQTRPILAYGASYLGGMLATASPCILASIPLVIGFVGGYAGENKKRAFFYSLTFVLGLAFIMALLGAMASLMGTMFGMHGPVWNFILAGVLIIMGLHLAGVIHLKLETSQKLIPQRTGLLGAFILGLLFGTVLSPCASPVLAVILTLAAVQQKVVYGSSLLFAYALGQGTLIILAGTFTGVLESFLASKGSNLGVSIQRTAGGLLFLAGMYVFYQGIRIWL